MDRLTKLSLNGSKYVSAIGSSQGSWPRIMARLAAYENTGLEPEEIENLKNGHCAGCYVPSCKIGDQAWGIRNYRGRRTAQCGLISEMYYRKDMALMVVVKHISRGVWGETIFRTQKEAEEAIREKEAKQ